MSRSSAPVIMGKHWKTSGKQKEIEKEKIEIQCCRHQTLPLCLSCPKDSWKSREISNYSALPPYSHFFPLFHHCIIVFTNSLLSCVHSVTYFHYFLLLTPLMTWPLITSPSQLSPAHSPFLSLVHVSTQRHIRLLLVA